mmetsp:Transcript_83890/g.234149  ORF Transcript_83890/g.234149 Transcript_83890/m.234149 type:complete len:216 (-) Transcript_83890:215-862(-)
MYHLLQHPLGVVETCICPHGRADIIPHHVVGIWRSVLAEYRRVPKCTTGNHHRRGAFRTGSCNRAVAAIDTFGFLHLRRCGAMALVPKVVNVPPTQEVTVRDDRDMDRTAELRDVAPMGRLPSTRLLVRSAHVYSDGASAAPLAKLHEVPCFRERRQHSNFARNPALRGKLSAQRFQNVRRCIGLFEEHGTHSAMRAEVRRTPHVNVDATDVTTD